MKPESTHSTSAPASFRDEFIQVWRQLPDKGVFFGLLAAWVGLFLLLGNSTLGYVDSPSIFGWLEWMYENSAGDEDHGRLIPFAVVALFWWKRKALLEVGTRHWWPGLALLVLALGLHLIGFIVQQPQISVVAFFGGIYALMGITWGPKWLAASFFPMCLFAFAVPIKNISEFLTFPLRLVATKITAFLCQMVLGINVVHDGTRIFDSLGQYQYEVAAACSGLRSLTATTALAVIYAFVAFKSPWRRLVILASAVPLAVAANVFRLSTIILAAEAFSQKAGDAVHDSAWLSLLPYVPAIGGILLLGWWLREQPETVAAPAQGLMAPAEQKL